MSGRQAVAESKERAAKAFFAARFKQCREELGETQQDFARRLSISPVSVLNYEQGRTVPSADRLVSIAARLEKAVAFFFPAETGVNEHPSPSATKAVLSAWMTAADGEAGRLATLFTAGCRREERHIVMACSRHLGPDLVEAALKRVIGRQPAAKMTRPPLDFKKLCGAEGYELEETSTDLGGRAALVVPHTNRVLLCRDGSEERQREDVLRDIIPHWLYDDDVPPESVTGVSADLRITNWHTSGMMMWGYDSREAVGKELSFFSGDGRAARSIRSLADKLGTDVESVSRLHRLVHKDNPRSNFLGITTITAEAATSSVVDLAPDDPRYKVRVRVLQRAVEAERLMRELTMPAHLVNFYVRRAGASIAGMSGRFGVTEDTVVARLEEVIITDSEQIKQLRKVSKSDLSIMSAVVNGSA